MAATSSRCAADALVLGLVLLSLALGQTAQADEEIPANDARVQLGVASGYASPGGNLGLDVSAFPLHWLGFELGAGMNSVAGSMSTLEMVELSWALAPWLEQGVGVGLSQLYVTLPTPLVDPAARHTIQYLTADATHLTVFITRWVAFRAEVGVSLAVGDAAFCTANPALCGPMGGLWGSGTLAFNLDLPRHEG